jgi:hypothetical protein
MNVISRHLINRAHALQILWSHNVSQKAQAVSIKKNHDERS